MGARTIPRLCGVLGIAGLAAKLGAQDTTRRALGGPRLVIDHVAVVDVEHGRLNALKRLTEWR